MICFQISIFEPLETTLYPNRRKLDELWFAFKLVSLNHWKQLHFVSDIHIVVVICFQISIFEPLETTGSPSISNMTQLWFAFKLVSLNHWKQPEYRRNLQMWVVICFQISIFEPLETTFNEMEEKLRVVICFQISIFEPLETTRTPAIPLCEPLWFAFKLVSLNHWKQQKYRYVWGLSCCDLLSN